MSRNVALSKDILACDAVDAIGTNDRICRCGRAVFEVEKHAAARFLLDGLEAFVEVCPSSRHSFDEFIEEMGAMNALHATWALLATDDFALMLTFALKEKFISASFRYLTKLYSRGRASFHIP